MRNIQLTDEEIKEFIYNDAFSKKFDIKYCEALFIRYLNEKREITLEQLDMLARKYHLGINIFSRTFNFSEYIRNIKFDKNSVFEVLIPTHALLNYRGYHLSYGINLIDELNEKLIAYEKANDASGFKQKIDISNSNQTYPSCYENVLENHKIAGLLWNDCVMMDNEYAEKVLEKQKEMYGEEVVDIIKTHVKSIHKESTFFGSKYTSR